MQRRRTSQQPTRLFRNLPEYLHEKSLAPAVSVQVQAMGNSLLTHEQEVYWTDRSPLLSEK